MIVDDDEKFLEELEETLSLSGYYTVAVSNGDSAVSMAKKVKADVVVLDLKMDGKNGLEVAKELRNIPSTSDVPIIAMTGFYTEQEYNKLINGYGIQTCLTKPFNPLDIITQIERALIRKNRKTC